MKGIVALVGRPNVGKSTLFNRLTEERRAIVHDTPGVTRDRLYGTAEWNGRVFTVIDTGGYLTETSDVFAAAIREQVEIALEEADIVLFLVDVKDGITPAEEDMAALLRRKAGKQVLLVANKVDNFSREMLMHEFYALGFDTIFPVSSINGQGTGDLLDAVTERLPEDNPAGEIEPGVPKLAIVGKPNVGKSSLVNALLGQEAHMVTPIAGTTRDSIYTRYKYFNFDFYLIDTAGLRKRAKVRDNIEFYSTIRTARAVEDCDIALVMIDAQEGILAQDLSVIRMVLKARKGICILVNKWDLAEKSQGFAEEYRKIIDEKLAPVSNVPVHFISATEKIRIYQALESVVDIYKARNKRIPTKELNERMTPIIERTPPQGARGKRVKIKFVSQVQGRNPSFVFFTNHAKLVPENYRRFLINQLQKEFGFPGTQISIYFKDDKS